MDRLIKASEIDFSDAATAPVISQSLRYVLPVPKLAGGGEELVGPRGGKLYNHGKLIRGRGIVFYDPDDRSWEVVPGDATGVILFSPITEDLGAELSTFIATITGRPEMLKLEELKEIVRYATQDLAIASAHSSTRQFVAESLEPVEDSAARGCGLYRRRRGDICRAVFVPGSGAFLGPGASPQRFSDGVVILKHHEAVRAVQRGSFEITYQFPDGRPARVAELPVQAPARRTRRTSAKTGDQAAHGRQT
jgi:hypothetical protein